MRNRKRRSYGTGTGFQDISKLLCVILIVVMFFIVCLVGVFSAASV